jgi:tRNA threonylcarbamoyladenosine biosynthesis protein TsaB
MLVFILGLESSGQYGSVALVSEGNLVAFGQHWEPNAHAERLLPMVDSALLLARRSRSDISRIAVGTGPGNFTGLRVGISLSYGLGIGLNIPVVGISSLAAMAHAVNQPECRVRVIVRDARKDELFWAVFDNCSAPLHKPSLVKRGEAHETIRSTIEKYVPHEEPWALAGDGLPGLNLDEMVVIGARIAENAEILQPNAKHTALLGAQSKFSDWPVPQYLREVDAILPQLCKNTAIELGPI